MNTHIGGMDASNVRSLNIINRPLFKQRKRRQPSLIATSTGYEIYIKFSDLQREINVPQIYAYADISQLIFWINFPPNSSFDNISISLWLVDFIHRLFNIVDWSFQNAVAWQLKSKSSSTSIKQLLDQPWNITILGPSIYRVWDVVINNFRVWRVWICFYIF